MSRPKKPPRLVLKRYKDRSPTWVIRDGQKTRSTGCGEAELSRAEEKLAEYFGQKYQAPGQSAAREIYVAEILATYTTEYAATTARPDIIAWCSENLLTFWGEKKLIEVRAVTCREYASWRTKQNVSSQTARRDLEVLRAAIKYYHSEYTLDSVPVVTLPAKSPPRDRWLTRDELAALLYAAWRNPNHHHVARFILMGVYTGTRSKAILGLTWLPQVNGGWIDLEQGVMHRSGSAQRRTKKRQPPVRLPQRLIPHLRRWREHDQKHGITHVVHYNGKPVIKLRRSWVAVRTKAGLEKDVVAHTLRHTAATWLMQAGVDIFQAAGFLGMTTRTLENVYGHHHPDFQQAAADSFSYRIGR
ncbi:MAG: site-specific integrase [Hyphomicrobiaceae bacterium]|nr:site-specific integrase [Hyphomicrobiaceae bacterium]